MSEGAGFVNTALLEEEHDRGRAACSVEVDGAAKARVSESWPLTFTMELEAR